MDIQYSKISKNLLESYDKDKHPFISKTSIKFPERDNVFEELTLLRELFFPDYWNRGFLTKSENKKELEIKINRLSEIVFNGIQPFVKDEEKTKNIVNELLYKLPEIRETLKKDIEAAFKGDPAAKDYTEIIRSYPGFNAIMVQRIANILYKFKVPSYPRELMEQIHSITGIDIHPGAEIGECFFIDHGTGVVIGETTKIGNNVRLYQGVTLGASSFKKDNSGILLKDYKRHPTLGNNVVIGAGAKILGPVNIGNNVGVGANSWIEEDIPNNTTVIISEHPKLLKKQKVSR